MASKQKLRGSIGSLSDTLAFRFDVGFPTAVASKWLGSMGNVSAAMRRTSDWHALAEEDDDFDSVIAVLDEATHAIVTASDNSERMEALESADDAVGSLNRLLDG